MRLLIVTQYFWPEEFRINDLALELARRGHEVTVLTGVPNYPSGKPPQAYVDDPSDFARYGDVLVLRVPMITRGSGGGLGLALNYLSFAASGVVLGLWRLRGRKFDCGFVFQTSPVTAALPMIAVKWLTGTPMLMWVQDIWPDSLAAAGGVRSPTVLGAVGALTAFIYRRCHRILIQSRAFDGKVRALAGEQARIDYLPNWADPALAGGLDGVDPAPEVEASPDRFTILFAGNVGEAQDLETVVRAADLSRDDPRLHWVIVGDGRALAGTRAAVEAAGLGDRVTFLGRFPAARMPEFFQVADALLVSLKPEPIFALTIPSKIQSYMAAGRPILAMLDGEGRRVVDEAGAGLSVAAGDAAGLAAAARCLSACSPDDLRAMGQAGFDYAGGQFDRDALVTRLEGWMAEAALCR
jgi:colanic acid biosynthesis glycosyl transferase WcaI